MEKEKATFIYVTSGEGDLIPLDGKERDKIIEKYKGKKVHYSLVYGKPENKEGNFDPVLSRDYSLHVDMEGNIQGNLPF